MTSDTANGAWGQKARPFCAHLARFGDDPQQTIAEIERLYARDLVFIDPLSELSSRDDFVRLQRRFLASMRQIQFVVEDALEGTDTAFVTTRLVLTPKWGPRLSLEAATHLRFTGATIAYQRDYFDLASSLVASRQPLSRLRSWLGKRLG